MHKGVKFIAALLAVLLGFEAVALPLAEAQQFDSVWMHRRSAMAPVSPVSAPAALTRRVPFHLADLSPVAIPARLGHTTETWSPPHPTSHPLVVLVQDIHENAAVQLNIAGILDSLKSEKTVLTVGMEGAWTPLDFTPYDNTAYDEWREMAARAFLERDYISGAHYFALTHKPQTVRLVGVEDKAPYLENLRARDRSKTQRDQMVRALQFVEDRMDRIGRHLLPLSIQELIKNKRHYEEGRLNLPDYLRYLVSLSDEVPPAVRRFVDLERAQQKLNAAEISAARDSLVRKLAGRDGSAGDTQQLLANAQAHQEGRLSAVGFHRFLLRLAAQRGVAVPAPLKDYRDYLESEAGFSAENLLDGAADLEKKVREEICARASSRTDIKRFLTLRQAIHDQKRLWALELTPKTADEALHIGQALQWKEAETFLTALENSLGLKTAPTVVPPYYWQAFQDVQTFYRLALERNQHLVKNLVSAVGEKKSSTIALMAGGFHTPGLTALLKKQQFPYVVVQPSTEANNPIENKVKVVGDLPAPNALIKLMTLSKPGVDPLVQQGLQQAAAGKPIEIRAPSAPTRSNATPKSSSPENRLRRQFLPALATIPYFFSDFLPRIAIQFQLALGLVPALATASAGTISQRVRNPLARQAAQAPSIEPAETAPSTSNISMTFKQIVGTLAFYGVLFFFVLPLLNGLFAVLTPVPGTFTPGLNLIAAQASLFGTITWSLDFAGNTVMFLAGLKIIFIGLLATPMGQALKVKFQTRIASAQKWIKENPTSSWSHAAGILAALEGHNAYEIWAKEHPFHFSHLLIEPVTMVYTFGFKRIDRLFALHQAKKNSVAPALTDLSWAERLFQKIPAVLQISLLPVFAFYGIVMDRLKLVVAGGIVSLIMNALGLGWLQEWNFLNRVMGSEWVKSFKGEHTVAATTVQLSNAFAVINTIFLSTVLFYPTLVKKNRAEGHGFFLSLGLAFVDFRKATTWKMYRHSVVNAFNPFKGGMHFVGVEIAILTATSAALDPVHHLFGGDAKSHSPFLRLLSIHDIVMAIEGDIMNAGHAVEDRLLSPLGLNPNAEAQQAYMELFKQKPVMVAPRGSGPMFPLLRWGGRTIMTLAGIVLTQVEGPSREDVFGSTPANDQPSPPAQLPKAQQSELRVVPEDEQIAPANQQPQPLITGFDDPSRRLLEVRQDYLDAEEALIARLMLTNNIPGRYKEMNKDFGFYFDWNGQRSSGHLTPLENQGDVLKEVEKHTNGFWEAINTVSEMYEERKKVVPTRQGDLLFIDRAGDGAYDFNVGRVYEYFVADINPEKLARGEDIIKERYFKEELPDNLKTYANIDTYIRLPDNRVFGRFAEQVSLDIDTGKIVRAQKGLPSAQEAIERGIQDGIPAAVRRTHVDQLVAEGKLEWHAGTLYSKRPLSPDQVENLKRVAQTNPDIKFIEKFNENTVVDERTKGYPSLVYKDTNGVDYELRRGGLSYEEMTMDQYEYVPEAPTQKWTRLLLAARASSALEREAAASKVLVGGALYGMAFVQDPIKAERDLTAPPKAFMGPMERGERPDRNSDGTWDPTVLSEQYRVLRLLFRDLSAGWVTTRWADYLGIRWVSDLEATVRNKYHETLSSDFKRTWTALRWLNDLEARFKAHPELDHEIILQNGQKARASELARRAKENWWIIDGKPILVVGREGYVEAATAYMRQLAAYKEKMARNDLTAVPPDAELKSTLQFSINAGLHRAVPRISAYEREVDALAEYKIELKKTVRDQEAKTRSLLRAFNRPNVSDTDKERLQDELVNAKKELERLNSLFVSVTETGTYVDKDRRHHSVRPGFFEAREKLKRMEELEKGVPGAAVESVKRFLIAISGGLQGLVTGALMVDENIMPAQFSVEGAVTERPQEEKFTDRDFLFKKHVDTVFDPRGVRDGQNNIWDLMTPGKNSQPFIQAFNVQDQPSFRLDGDITISGRLLKDMAFPKDFPVDPNAPISGKRLIYTRSEFKEDGTLVEKQYVLPEVTDVPATAFAAAVEKWIADNNAAPQTSREVPQHSVPNAGRRERDELGNSWQRAIAGDGKARIEATKTIGDLAFRLDGDIRINGRPLKDASIPVDPTTAMISGQMRFTQTITHDDGTWTQRQYVLPAFGDTPVWDFASRVTGMIAARTLKPSAIYRLLPRNADRPNEMRIEVTDEHGNKETRTYNRPRPGSPDFSLKDISAEKSDTVVIGKGVPVDKFSTVEYPIVKTFYEGRLVSMSKLRSIDQQTGRVTREVIVVEDGDENKVLRRRIEVTEEGLLYSRLEMATNRRSYFDVAREKSIEEKTGKQREVILYTVDAADKTKNQYGTEGRPLIVFDVQHDDLDDGVMSNMRTIAAYMQHDYGADTSLMPAPPAALELAKKYGYQPTDGVHPWWEITRASSKEPATDPWGIAASVLPADEVENPFGVTAYQYRKTATGEGGSEIGRVFAGRERTGAFFLNQNGQLVISGPATATVPTDLTSRRFILHEMEDENLELRLTGAEAAGTVVWATRSRPAGETDEDGLVPVETETSSGNRFQHREDIFGRQNDIERNLVKTLRGNRGRQLTNVAWWEFEKGPESWKAKTSTVKTDGKLTEQRIRTGTNQYSVIAFYNDKPYQAIQEETTWDDVPRFQWMKVDDGQRFGTASDPVRSRELFNSQGGERLRALLADYEEDSSGTSKEVARYNMILRAGVPGRLDVYDLTRASLARRGEATATRFERYSAPYGPHLIEPFGKFIGAFRPRVENETRGADALRNVQIYYDDDSLFKFIPPWNGFIQSSWFLPDGNVRERYRVDQNVRAGEITSDVHLGVVNGLAISRQAVPGKLPIVHGVDPAGKGVYQREGDDVSAMIAAFSPVTKQWEARLSTLSQPRLSVTDKYDSSKLMSPRPGPAKETEVIAKELTSQSYLPDDREGEPFKKVKADYVNRRFGTTMHEHTQLLDRDGLVVVDEFNAPSKDWSEWVFYPQEKVPMTAVSGQDVAISLPARDLSKSKFILVSVEATDRKLTTLTISDGNQTVEIGPKKTVPYYSLAEGIAQSYYVKLPSGRIEGAAVVPMHGHQRVADNPDGTNLYMVAVPDLVLAGLDVANIQSMVARNDSGIKAISGVRRLNAGAGAFGEPQRRFMKSGQVASTLPPPIIRYDKARHGTIIGYGRSKERSYQVWVRGQLWEISYVETEGTAKLRVVLRLFPAADPTLARAQNLRDESTNREAGLYVDSSSRFAGVFQLIGDGYKGIKRIVFGLDDYVLNEDGFRETAPTVVLYNPFAVFFRDKTDAVRNISSNVFNAILRGFGYSDEELVRYEANGHLKTALLRAIDRTDNYPRLYRATPALLGNDVPRASDLPNRPQGDLLSKQQFLEWLMLSSADVGGGRLMPTENSPLVRGEPTKELAMTARLAELFGFIVEAGSEQRARETFDRLYELTDAGNTPAFHGYNVLTGNPEYHNPNYNVRGSAENWVLPNFALSYEALKYAAKYNDPRALDYAMLMLEHGMNYQVHRVARAAGEQVMESDDPAGFPQWKPGEPVPLEFLGFKFSGYAYRVPDSYLVSDNARIYRYLKRIRDAVREAGMIDRVPWLDAAVEEQAAWLRRFVLVKTDHGILSHYIRQHRNVLGGTEKIEDTLHYYIAQELFTTARSSLEAVLAAKEMGGYSDKELRRFVDRVLELDGTWVDVDVDGRTEQRWGLTWTTVNAAEQALSPEDTALLLEVAKAIHAQDLVNLAEKSINSMPRDRGGLPEVVGLTPTRRHLRDGYRPGDGSRLFPGLVDGKPKWERNANMTLQAKRALDGEPSLADIQVSKAFKEGAAKNFQGVPPIPSPWHQVNAFTIILYGVIGPISAITFLWTFFTRLLFEFYRNQHFRIKTARTPQAVTARLGRNFFRETAAKWAVEIFGGRRYPAETGVRNFFLAYQLKEDVAGIEAFVEALIKEPKGFSAADQAALNEKVAAVVKGIIPRLKLGTDVVLGTAELSVMSNLFLTYFYFQAVNKTNSLTDPVISDEVIYDLMTKWLAYYRYVINARPMENDGLLKRDFRVTEDMEYFFSEIWQELALIVAQRSGLTIPQSNLGRLLRRSAEPPALDQVLYRAGIVADNHGNWTFSTDLAAQQFRAYQLFEPRSSVNHGTEHPMVQLASEYYFPLTFALLLMSATYGVFKAHVDPLLKSIPGQLVLPQAWISIEAVVVGLAFVVVGFFVLWGINQRFTRNWLKHGILRSSRKSAHWFPRFFIISPGLAILAAGIFLFPSAALPNIGLLKFVFSSLVFLELGTRLIWDQSFHVIAWKNRFAPTEMLGGLRSVFTTLFLDTAFLMVSAFMGMATADFFIPPFGEATQTGILLSYAGIFTVVLLGLVIRHLSNEGLETVLAKISTRILNSDQRKWFNNNLRLREYRGLLMIFLPYAAILFQKIISSSFAADARLMVATSHVILILMLTYYAIWVIETVVSASWYTALIWVLTPFGRGRSVGRRALDVLYIVLVVGLVAYGAHALFIYPSTSSVTYWARAVIIGYGAVTLLYMFFAYAIEGLYDYFFNPPIRRTGPVVFTLAGVDPLSSPVFTPEANGDPQLATDIVMENWVDLRQDSSNSIQHYAMAHTWFLEGYAERELANGHNTTQEAVILARPLFRKGKQIDEEKMDLLLRRLILTLHQEEADRGVTLTSITRQLERPFAKEKLSYVIGRSLTAEEQEILDEKLPRHLSFYQPNMTDYDVQVLREAHTLRRFLIISKAGRGNQSYDSAVYLTDIAEAITVRKRRGDDYFPVRFYIPENFRPQKNLKNRYERSLRDPSPETRQRDYLCDLLDHIAGENVAEGQQVESVIPSKALGMGGMLLGLMPDSNGQLTESSLMIVNDRNTSSHFANLVVDRILFAYNDKRVSVVFPFRDSPKESSNNKDASGIAVGGERGMSSLVKSMELIGYDVLSPGWATIQTIWLDLVERLVTNPLYRKKPDTLRLKQNGFYGLLDRAFGTSMPVLMHTPMKSEDLASSVMADKATLALGMSPRRSVQEVMLQRAMALLIIIVFKIVTLQWKGRGLRQNWRNFTQLLSYLGEVSMNIYLKSREAGSLVNLIAARGRWASGFDQFRYSTVFTPTLRYLSIYARTSGRTMVGNFYALAPFMIANISLYGFLIINDWTSFRGVNAPYLVLGMVAASILIIHGIFGLIEASGLLIGSLIGLRDLLPNSILFSFDEFLKNFYVLDGLAKGPEDGFGFDLSQSSSRERDTAGLQALESETRAANGQVTPKTSRLSDVVVLAFVMFGAVSVYINLLAVSRLDVLNVVLLYITLLVLSGMMLAFKLNDNIRGNHSRYHFFSKPLGWITGFVLVLAFSATFGVAPWAHYIASSILILVSGLYTVRKLIPRYLNGRLRYWVSSSNGGEAEVRNAKYPAYLTAAVVALAIASFVPLFVSLVLFSFGLLFAIADILSIIFPKTTKRTIWTFSTVGLFVGILMIGLFLGFAPYLSAIGGVAVMLAYVVHAWWGVIKKGVAKISPWLNLKPETIEKLEGKEETATRFISELVRALVFSVVTWMWAGTVPFAGLVSYQIGEYLVTILLSTSFLALIGLVGGYVAIIYITEFVEWFQFWMMQHPLYVRILRASHSGGAIITDPYIASRLESLRIAPLVYWQMQASRTAEIALYMTQYYLGRAKYVELPPDGTAIQFSEIQKPRSLWHYHRYLTFPVFLFALTAPSFAHGAGIEVVASSAKSLDGIHAGAILLLIALLVSGKRLLVGRRQSSTAAPVAIPLDSINSVISAQEIEGSSAVLEAVQPKTGSGFKRVVEAIRGRLAEALIKKGPVAHIIHIDSLDGLDKAKVEIAAGQYLLAERNDAYILVTAPLGIQEQVATALQQKVIPFDGNGQALLEAIERDTHQRRFGQKLDFIIRSAEVESGIRKALEKASSDPAALNNVLQFRLANPKDANGFLRVILEYYFGDDTMGDLFALKNHTFNTTTSVAEQLLIMQQA